MFVPILSEAVLDVALAHVELGPMDDGTVFTDKHAVSDVEHCGWVFTAINAV